ncbi:RagB/SusD family nutrient uptake outer membrane protein [Arthrospiribacter ruber]|uniref:RagB/SusD family nutrient uptake outer membrane protein n=1 Tax=Arthrospiribacter ruber TaxID=2487934 RepID=A0A951IYJ9_9BACT|nr:RagB/SusD family nutrient uptake outer membrane protein [Arthrospiribacter ruber]MBW3468211.1 RagB/SusD family nutrient uptake outer membrane protein [Arthrospiribacter ruber]
MKKIIKKSYKILALILLSTMACTDLSERPYNVLVEEDLGSSPEVLAALTAPVYTRLTDLLYGWHGYFDLVEECSDAIVTPARPNGWIDGGVYRNMHMHTWNAFQSHPSGLWNRAYGSLNILNNALLNYQTIEGENIPVLVSELRALRAFYYYLLVDAFGNVPIVTEENLLTPDELPSQSSRREVFDFIEAELLDIMDIIPEEKVYGKMNKWAAKMILAKIYLNAEVYIGEAKYQQAIAQVDDIINSGLYILEPNYHTNFVTNNQSSREQIFSVIFDETRAGWFHYHWKTLHPASAATYNLGTAPWGGSAAIPQFIDTYEEGDSRFDIWIRGPQFSLSGQPIFNSMDPSLREVQLDYQNTMGSVDATREYEGYRVGKYEIEIGSVGPLSNDVPFFRYADALMIKAESLLRTGNADAAAQIVTEVRMRSFENPDDAVVTGAELMQGSRYQYGNYESGSIVSLEGGDDVQYGRFLDELGYEFAAEFHRRQDLIRFGVFTSKSWLTHRPNGNHRTIFPIPQPAIDANPNLNQNPGYN